MSREDDLQKAEFRHSAECHHQGQGPARSGIPGKDRKSNRTPSFHNRRYLLEKRNLAVGLLASILIALTGSTLAGKSASAKAGSAAVVRGIIAASNFKCTATGSTASNHVPVPGAVPDVSTDDSAAIQDAIDAAGREGGGIVTLPAGTFIINGHLALRNNVELNGSGPATVIKAGPDFTDTQGTGGGYPIISTAGASNTTISNLTADQSGDTLNGNVPTRLYSYVVEARDSSNVVVQNVYVRHPFTYSIAMVRSTEFCVENSDVQVSTSANYSQLDGIHILDSSSGQVINNVIQSGDDGLAAHTMGAPVHDVLFANNKVHGGDGASGLQLAVGGFPIYNIKVENNEFYGGLFGVHTGYYADGAGNVRNVAISDNYIHDLLHGQQSPAVQIGDSGQPGSISNVTATGNRTCHAGAIEIQVGSGNAVRGTTTC